jgi:CheY-like chemotaxis protein
LVEEQGGLLKVTSDPGLGSSFSVTLRFEIADTTQQEVVTTKKSITPDVARKVIVVDDDAMILRLCSLILENNKIPHVIYNDPTKVASKEPDRDVSHILIDIRMPSMSGVELCHILRGKYDPATKLVALTAHVLPQEQQELLKEGFDAVLPKPFREQELLSLFGVVSYPENSITTDIYEEIDLTVLKKMTQGDEGLFQSILAQFIDETENDLKKLDADFKQLNPKIVRDVVHKLAGRIGQVGALSLSSKLRDIENNLVNGTPLVHMIDNIGQAKEEIESLLKTVRGHVMAQSEG